MFAEITLTKSYTPVPKPPTPLPSRDEDEPDKPPKNNSNVQKIQFR